uniref:CCHC-type domain-containing protein n=1 Tax=Sciurus vulgaris TaxID=55149 RepID=A0A8D2DDC1_SCIVU
MRLIVLCPEGWERAVSRPYLSRSGLVGESPLPLLLVEKSKGPKDPDKNMPLWPKDYFEQMKKSKCKVRNSPTFLKYKQSEANTLPLKNDAVQSKHKTQKGKRTIKNISRKNVVACFYCRKPGHGIAGCSAALGNQDMGIGTCCLCGSTNPSIGEFPFVKCLVCGEMGQLSRSCHDNPKGLYYDSDQIVPVGHLIKGMSTDYEELLDTPTAQKPTTKIPKVVHF